MPGPKKLSILFTLVSHMSSVICSFVSNSSTNVYEPSRASSRTPLSKGVNLQAPEDSCSQNKPLLSTQLQLQCAHNICWCARSLGIHHHGYLSTVDSTQGMGFPEHDYGSKCSRVAPAWDACLPAELEDAVQGLVQVLLITIAVPCDILSQLQIRSKALSISWGEKKESALWQRHFQVGTWPLRSPPIRDMGTLEVLLNTKLSAPRDKTGMCGISSL